MTTPEIASSTIAPFIKRIGAITQVAVVASAQTAGAKLEPVAAENLRVLPTEFHAGTNWYLTHYSLASDEQITLNWQYKHWFDEGDGLSTYYFRDEDLLDDIARVFSRLVPVREGSGPELDYEYHISDAKNSATAVLPSLLFYTSTSGKSQFLALYNRHDADPSTGQLSSVSVYEIVQVELAEVETLRMRLFKAHQAAIRYRREHRN